MQNVLHIRDIRATVQPGGKLEIVCPELEAGQTVDVEEDQSVSEGDSLVEVAT